VTTIKFTLKLSARTMRAFDNAGLSSAAEVKDDLVEQLKAYLDETCDEHADDDEDEEDDDE
jgi:hypothetical protein